MNSTKRLMLIVALVIVALLAVACDTTPVNDPTLDTFGTPDPSFGTGDDGLGTTIGDGEISGQVVLDGSAASLPDDAIVTVQLVDVSTTNTTAEVLAESTIQDVDAFPVDSTLTYDPALIDASSILAVQAVVTDSDNNLLYANMNQYRVLTAGNPTDNVEVILEPIQSQ
jgi:uncharacterized lipoprotein YbaY